MKAGDIYHVDLDPVKGHEQSGKRFVLVISDAAYNSATGMPVVAAITGGGDFARMKGFTVSLSGLGTKTQGVVRLDQIRAIDMRNRGGTFVESLPRQVLDDVLGRVIAIFEP